MVMNWLLAALIDRVVDLHYCSLVTTTVTIIRCGEDCNDLSIMLPLVPLHNKLVGTGNKMKPINVGELLCNVLAESISSPPRWDTPTTSFFGIWFTKAGKGQNAFSKNISSNTCNFNEKMKHTGHLGRTTPNHTWVPRVVPLELYQGHEHDRVYQSRGKDPHANKIYDRRQRQSLASSQTYQWSASKHLRFHTFWDIRHRNRWLA